ncbi:MAG: hypothetical protein KatS3mg111_0218 [Pirellulaceae bacterium]|nr:MAG: hypothetical protein KatS3mg111_0218 [Pirellulaceae bacterium]
MRQSDEAKLARDRSLIETNPLVECVFPPGLGEESLATILARRQAAASSDLHVSGQKISERLRQLLDVLASLDATARCPLVAVVGGLNAGKSTLVRTFLSPAGQRRVLCGASNDAGTHRFVIWLPARWREDASLTAALTQQLESIMGQGVELLSEDPQEAREQYNRPTTNIPLLAFDTRLDALSIGLIDSPDIQTGILPGAATGPVDEVQTTAQRAELLQQMGQLCSAFLLVTTARSLHDQALGSVYGELVKSLPNCRRYLVINKVRPCYAPEQIRQDAMKLLARFRFDGMYMAYRVDAQDVATLSAAVRPEASLAHTDDMLHPRFFQLPIAHDWDPNKPAYLEDLGTQLDAGTLAAEHHREIRQQVAQTLHDALLWFEENDTQAWERIHQVWMVLATACHRLLCDAAHGNQVRVQASVAVARQYADTLRETAPFYLRLSGAMERPLQKAYGAIGHAVAHVGRAAALPGWLRNLHPGWSKKAHESAIHDEDLKEHLRLADRWGVLDSLEDEQLKDAVATALHRFNYQDPTVLPPEQVQEWCHQYWQQIGRSRKLSIALRPVMILAAPLAAVLFIPLDFGGSAVLAFASAKELLLALGASAAGLAMSSDKVFDVAVEAVGKQQLSNQFALLCDALGVPRPTTDQLAEFNRRHPHRALLPPTIPSTTIRDRPTLLELWQLKPEGETALTTLIAELTAREIP